MKLITKRQAEVFRFIQLFIEERMYPPTFREIASHFNVSSKCAYDHVKALEKKQYLVCNSNHARSIERLERERNREDEHVQIPLLGHVSAGQPGYVEEYDDGKLSLPEYMVGKGDVFALRVEGESMINAGILDGDIAILRKQETADNGDIVAVLVYEAVTLKRFFRERNRIRLQPENPALNPIYTGNARVLGLLVTLIRSY